MISRCLPWILVWSAALCGQEQERDPLAAPAELTSTALEARVARVQELEGLAEGLKTALVEAYSAALQQVRDRDALQSASAGYRASIETAAGDLAETRSRIAALGEPEVDLEGTLDQVEPRLENARQALERAGTDESSLELEIAHRRERQGSIPNLLTEARRELEELTRQLQAPPATEEPPYLTAARRTRQLARQGFLELEVEVLPLELQLYQATGELQDARRELAVRQQALASAEVDALQSRVQALLLEQAARDEERAQQAAREAAQQHPLLEKVAQENAALAGKRTALTADLARGQEELTDAKKRLEDLDDDFTEVRSRVDEVGLTEAVGALLRQRRSQAPVPTRGLRLRVEARREEIAATRLDLFDFEDQERDLLDIPEMEDRLLDAEVPPLDPQQRESLRGPLSGLLEARRGIVGELRDDAKQYFDLLVEIDGTQHKILSGIDEYRDYINERVLWIRSSAPAWRLDWSALVEAAAWVSDPQSWYQAGLATVEMVLADPGRILLLLLAAVLILLRSRLRRDIRGDGALAAKYLTTVYWPTARSAAYTALLALPFPLLLWTVGYGLQDVVDPTSFSRALGFGLERAGWILFMLGLLRHVLRPEGLGQSHFQWNPRAIATLRRNLSWLMCVAIPVAWTIGTIASRDYAPWSGSLGRTALMVGTAALAVFFFRVLHPRRGILCELGAGSGWLVRMRTAWFLLGTGVPLSLFFLCFLGYGFTALQLMQRLEVTCAMLFLVFLVQALIVRSLFLTHRKLAIERARERRRAAREAQEAPVESGELPVLEEEEIDPTTIALQTRQLLRMAFACLILIGAWQIWVEVLPALGLLREKVLWADVVLDPVTQLPVLDPVTQLPLLTNLVTLANLLLAVLVAFVTFLAARNIPGFLELVLLRRLDVGEGERHAITTLVTYTLVAAGIIASFSVIGIGWSKVQWLLAAMSVGLGFGLQEVFANFVSGVILLFERPIRVGDVVTVGDTMARVKKMRIRATTLVDWDRRELVVPNKEFVTARFTNWTLSDPITRVTFPVGIAYGSDTRKAQELLLMVARSNPLVLDEPKTRAIFRGFGESSLDFELRVFMRNLDELPQLMNEINTGIDDAFKKDGIEIAFPQRDLHLRSAPAIVEYLGHQARSQAQRVQSD